MEQDQAQMEGKPSPAGPKTTLWVFLGVIFLGLITAFFGFFEIVGQIKLPFLSEDQPDLAVDDSAYIILDLQSKDTDQDTLSDYEELYFYGTSPYLADSDSDGVDDATEISETSDPNCPKGESCAVVANSNVNTADSNSNTQLDSDEISLDALKDTLQTSGAPENTVQNLDDQELLETYTEVTGEEITSVGDNTNTKNGQASEGISVSSLENLSAPEIRIFLQLGGADVSSLEQMDDETLIKIFNEALQQQ